MQQELYTIALPKKIQPNKPVKEVKAGNRRVPSQNKTKTQSVLLEETKTAKQKEWQPSTSTQTSLQYDADVVSPQLQKKTTDVDPSNIHSSSSTTAASTSEIPVTQLESTKCNSVRNEIISTAAPPNRSPKSSSVKKIPNNSKLNDADHALNSKPWKSSIDPTLASYKSVLMKKNQESTMQEPAASQPHRLPTHDSEQLTNEGSDHNPMVKSDSKAERNHSDDEDQAMSGMGHRNSEALV
jgi:hypothetical protein